MSAAIHLRTLFCNRQEGVEHSRPAGGSARSTPPCQISSFPAPPLTRLARADRVPSPPRARSNRNSKIYGTSGGALTGCLLFLDIDLDALAEYAYICAAEARASIRGAFKLRDYCRGAITQFCTANAHEILQGRFEVSITRIFPWYKNLRVNNFPTYDFLIQSLMCSACITPLAGFPMWLKGHGLCFDGGVSDFQILKGLARNGTFCKLHCRKTNPKDLVVVCPFYSSRADIRPSKYVPIWWAFYPPPPYKLKELFELGQKDAHAWCDKQEDAGGTSPEKDDSPRATSSEGSRSSDEDDDMEWEWQRKEKARGGDAKDLSRESSVTADDQDMEPPTSPTATTNRGFTEWAAECQEWASLSAEAAARRAMSAARAAANKAEAFVHHEAEVVHTYASGKFCQAQAAAEAMRRVASKSNLPEIDLIADLDDDDPEEEIPRGRFQAHRLLLKSLACMVIYLELVAQTLLNVCGAGAALLLPGIRSGKLREKVFECCRPLPRVLLQPVPGVRKVAKIDGKTAKALGNISVAYRVLCYLVHMEVHC